jgi:hypothetical protein
MNNEFKKTSSKNQTTYTLESATAGGTSSGSIASTNGDNLIAQESDKKKIPSSTPRNFVAKNAKTGGAGAHKDKKKAEKQGNVKHKKPLAEDHEIQMASSELQSIAKDAVNLLSLVRRYSEKDGLDAWQQSKITKAADYLNAVLQSVSGEQGVAEGVDKQALQKELMIINELIKAMKNSWQQQHLLQKKEELLKQLKQGVAEAFQNDESNLFYIYDKSSGRLKQRMIQNLDEPKARSAGYRDSVDDALKHAGIIRSKFDPKKFIQNQGGKWVQVFPFGEQGVAEAIPSGNEYEQRQKLIKYIARQKDWDASDLEHSTTPELIQLYKECQADRKDWNNRRSDWWDRADALAKEKGIDKSNALQQTPHDLDKDNVQGQLKFKKQGAAEGAMSDLDADRKEKQYKGTQAYHAKKKADKEKSSADAKKAFDNKFGGGNPANNLKIREHDQYSESLDQMLERQLEPTMDLDTWDQNFQNADPQKYHQFKNKTPEKKK